MLERQRDVPIPIAAFFKRQRCSSPRWGFYRLRAAIGRFHDAGPTAGDHREARVGQQLRDLLGQFIVAVPRFQARGTKDGNSRRDVVSLSAAVTISAIMLNIHHESRAAVCDC